MCAILVKYSIPFKMKISLLFVCMVLIISETFWGNLYAEHLISVQVTTSGQISLSAQDTTLGDLCKELSNKTQSSIRIPKEWQELRVSITFEKKNLLDSLHLILKKASLNYALHKIPAKKMVFITIVGHNRANETVMSSTDTSGRADIAITDIRDLDVVPPDKPGGKGITRRDIDRIHASLEPVDPLDLEVVPPERPGEKGITRRELNQIRANMEPADPLNLEVVPPDIPGVDGNAIMYQNRD